MKSGMRAEVSEEESFAFRLPGIVMSVVKDEFQADFGKRSICDFTLTKFT